jgi:hypothetical protein
MLVNFAWPRLATNPAISAAFPGAANWPIIGGAPIVELSVAVLLIVGGCYWLGVQRPRIASDLTTLSGQQRAGRTCSPRSLD